MKIKLLKESGWTFNKVDKIFINSADMSDYLSLEVVNQMSFKELKQYLGY